MSLTSEAVSCCRDESKAAESDRFVVFEKLIDWLINSDPEQIRDDVQRLRERYPEAADEELVEKLVVIQSIKNGLVGAATGVTGFLAIPVALPVDLLASWKIQINLAMCIAHLYGNALDRRDVQQLKTDILAIMAGSSREETIEVMGVEIDQVTQESVRRYLTREATIELWKHLGLRIIRKTGSRSLVRLSKVVPLVGAPIGFAFDYAATRRIGENARQYYARDNRTAV
ncbi:MAG: EcsC family protein [Planctomycetaceae bacterium]|nr:EcsC family protein [Planctomycetaceae bacterium]